MRKIEIFFKSEGVVSKYYNTRLRKILESGKKDHFKEILESHNSLKRAHIYCKINDLNGQKTGSLIERYYIHKFNMIKNDSKDCIGDAVHKGKNIEIKVSNGTSNNNKFNFVQLRLNHDCIYLFSCYYISMENIDRNGELFIFKLNKESIKDLILKYGNYAHGTEKKLGKITKDSINKPDNNNSYCLRPIYNSDCWKELLTYRIDESSV